MEGIVSSTKCTMDLEGARLLTYSTICYGKPRLCMCINIHHYAPLHIVLQQAAVVHTALRALRREYTVQCRGHLIT